MADISDTVAGLILIACGFGMVWSARAYVTTRRDSHSWARKNYETRHGHQMPWWAELRWRTAPRTELVLAYTISAAAIVGGLLLLL